MSLSKYTVITDGLTKQYPLTFTDDYLEDDEEIVVYVDGNLDGEGNQIYLPYSFITDYLIELDNLMEAGLELVIQRNTSNEALYTDLLQRGAIRSADINNIAKQLLHLVQQNADGRFTSSFQQDLDMGLNRIVNLGEPVDDNDAVRLVDLGDVPLYVADATAQAVIATTQAGLSSASAVSASTSEANALGHANTAEGARDNALLAQAAAEGARDLAQGYAIDADVAKIEWQGDWLAGSYNANDAVYHNGSSYIANIDTSGEPGISYDWDVLALAGTLTNPMTSLGDIIVGSADGTPTRLGLGTNGYVTQSNGTTLVYGQVGTTGIADGAVTADKLASSISFIPDGYINGLTAEIESNYAKTDLTKMQTFDSVTRSFPMNGTSNYMTVSRGVTGNLADYSSFVIDFPPVTFSDTGTLRLIAANSATMDFSGFAVGRSAGNKFTWYLGSNGTANNLVNAGVGTYTVLPNTKYWLRFEFTGAAYNLYYSTDGINYTLTLTLATTTKLYSPSSSMSFGSYFSLQYALLGTMYMDGAKITLDDTTIFDGSLFNPSAVTVYKGKTKSTDNSTDLELASGVTVNIKDIFDGSAQYGARWYYLYLTPDGLVSSVNLDAPIGYTTANSALIKNYAWYVLPYPQSLYVYKMFYNSNNLCSFYAKAGLLNNATLATTPTNVTMFAPPIKGVEVTYNFMSSVAVTTDTTIAQGSVSYIITHVTQYNEGEHLFQFAEDGNILQVSSQTSRAGCYIYQHHFRLVRG